nr:MAG TPA: hypothetical protein [Caudoviricetes sp.]
MKCSLHRLNRERGYGLFFGFYPNAIMDTQAITK